MAKGLSLSQASEGAEEGEGEERGREREGSGRDKEEGTRGLMAPTRQTPSRQGRQGCSLRPSQDEGRRSAKESQELNAR
jgi:hypothetical protein